MNFTFYYGFYFIHNKEVQEMLRSIKKAYEIIKEQDNGTSITVHTIRVWCKEGIL